VGFLKLGSTSGRFSVLASGGLNRPEFTGGQNFPSIAHYGTDTKEEDRDEYQSWAMARIAIKGKLG
jgi:hypothetical protein